MKKSSDMGWIVGLIFVLIGIAFAVGWIMNIVAIVHSSFSPIGGMLVVRVIGVFVAPVGGVLGYL